MGTESVSKDMNKKRKKKLQLHSTEKLHEDRKRDERAEYDGEATGSGEKKDRKKYKMSGQRELEFDWTRMENEFLKDKRSKDDTEDSEISNEKDRKNKKDKYGGEAIAVDVVSNDTFMVAVENARKGITAMDYTQVSEVGCDKKRKDRKTKKKKKKDDCDVDPSLVHEVSNDAHTKKVGKSRKKGKRIECHNETSKDEQRSNMNIMDVQTSHKEEKNGKKKKKKNSDDLGAGLQESEADKPVNASSDGSFMDAGNHKISDGKGGVNDDDVGNSKRGRKKKAKSVEKVSDGKVQRARRKETPKSVSLSDQLEVFPSCDGLTDEENAYADGPSNMGNADKDGIVRGKRFSLEEDEMIKKAVFDYIEQNNLGEEGVDKILHCKAHKELRNCWNEISAALPWRPHRSVYVRAHVLFEGGEVGKWTAEDYEFILKCYEKHGPRWKMMADTLGKHWRHVFYAWRRIKLPNMKKGHWSQDEYQTLFDLVNMDLRMKASEEKKSNCGMLRDNIAWSAISDKLSTRTMPFCCYKWYSQLTSSMVAEGVWADTDDYRLVDALQNLDACSMEDVDWDNLLEHRPGDLCRKRLKQMVNHLGHLGTKSFAEQVDVLSERYCLDVLKARVAYNSRPAADS